MSKPKEQSQRDKSKAGSTGAGKTRVRRRGRKPPRVPPPDSAIWPEEYRGKNWKSIYAVLFAGRCQVCAYSCPQNKWRQLQDRFHGLPRLLLCTNHPHSPGELHEVLPIETCRNFKPKPWQPKRKKAREAASTPPFDASNPSVKRISLGRGLFATVDAEDYEKVSKYRWHVFRYARCTYAVCHVKGRTVFMHRMIMKPRKGYVVDHIDGNGLNNRRCNLRVCTPAQNRANAGPRGGSSRFVGVYRKRDKWKASIQRRGKRFTVGTFDDEVEAAKARDRKAYELHGEYAYLNFPEDFDRQA